MKVSEAKEITGSLSRPGKMPGKAYSLPAQECAVGSILRNIPGSTCSGCYALKGRYVFQNVKRAQYKRLNSITDPRWVEAMTVSLRSLIKAGHRYFRWHDAGDIQSLSHLHKIMEVCENTPEMSHWLPTRERRIIKENERPIPDNLTIRVSSAMMGGKPLAAHGLTSTVDSGVGHVCPAQNQEGKCGDCRACWDKSVANVDYPSH